MIFSHHLPLACISEDTEYCVCKKNRSGLMEAKERSVKISANKKCLRLMSLKCGQLFADDNSFMLWEVV